MLHICLDDSPRFRWIDLGTVDSTNNYLKAYRPPTLPDMVVVTAREQTAGRGQTGHRWESRAGENLLSSFLVRTEGVEPADSFVLNQAVALATRDACQEFLEQYVVKIKWPNDIYVGERKLCGMLIETEMRGTEISRFVAGIGVNVNQTEFASELPNPVSLKQLTRNEVLVRNVLEQLVGHMQQRLNQALYGDREALRLEYWRRMMRIDGLFTYRDAKGEFLASLQRVEPTGHLVIRDAHGVQRRYAFQEVEYVF